MRKVDVHHHDFYEIYFLVSGETVCSVESRQYRVTPGDILLVSPRELHKLRILSELESYERYILWVHPRIVRKLSTSKTDLLQYMDPTSPVYRNQIHMTPEEQQHIYGMIRYFYQELQSGGYGDDLMAESFLTQLLVTVNRIAAHEEVPEEDPALANPTVSGVVEYIGTHYGEPLSLEALAERFFVSKYHLSHEFSRLVGTSVHRYIIKKRLMIARQQLAQGKHPNEVWEPCGFGDYTGFYRAFQSEYGMSPREYANTVSLEHV